MVQRPERRISQATARGRFYFGQLSHAGGDIHVLPHFDIDLYGIDDGGQLNSPT